MNSTTKRMTLGIMLALVAWAVYLSIGATGIFVQESMLDLRKSLIVGLCVAFFLALWFVVLLGNRAKAKRSHASQNSVSTARNRRWSKPGIATLVCIVAAIASWGIAIATWKSISPSATTILGWLSAALVMGSAVSGMIALSERRAPRGKWLGMLGLVGFVVALIGFVLRMSPR